MPLYFFLGNTHYKVFTMCVVIADQLLCMERELPVKWLGGKKGNLSFTGKQLFKCIKPQLIFSAEKGMINNKV
jgi:hypothetical protein